MNRWRPSLGSAIGSAAVFSVFYLVSIALRSSAALVFALFALASVAMAWMAIRILRDPSSTNKTFDDQFYQDRDDIRRGETE